MWLAGFVFKAFTAKTIQIASRTKRDDFYINQGTGCPLVFVRLPQTVLPQYLFIKLSGERDVRVVLEKHELKGHGQRKTTSSRSLNIIRAVC